MCICPKCHLPGPACPQGALQRLAGALSKEPRGGEVEVVRGQVGACHLPPATHHLPPATSHLPPATCHLQVRAWFQTRLEELAARNFTKKESRRLVSWSLVE